jgi:hypothetical protein
MRLLHLAILAAASISSQHADGAALELTQHVLGGPALAVVHGSGYLYNGAGAALQVRDELSGELLFEAHAGGPVRGLAWSASHLVAAADVAGISVFSLANPLEPELLATLDIGEPALAVDLESTLAHVAAGKGGYFLIDLAKPSKPKVVGHLASADYVYRDLDASPGRAIVASNDAIWWIDVEDPAEPFVAGGLGGIGDPRGVEVVGNTAYVAAGVNALEVVDVSQADLMTRLGGLPVGGEAVAVTVVDTLALVADRLRGLRVVSIVDPRAPVERGTVATEVEAASLAWAGGNLACVGGAGGGLDISWFGQPNNPRLVSSFYTGGKTAGTALLEGGVAAGVGQGGVELLANDNPLLLEPVSRVATGGPVHAIDADDGLVFAAQGGQGLAIVDAVVLSEPHLLATIAGEEPWDGVAVSGNYAYMLSTTGQRVRVVDVTHADVPLLSAAIAQFDEPVSGIAAVDSLVAVSLTGQFGSDGGLAVLDASLPIAPTRVGDLRGFERVYGVAKSDGGRFFLAAGAAGLIPVDVRMPDYPLAQLPWRPAAGEVIAVSVRGDRAAVVVRTESSAALVYLDTTEGELPRELARYEAVALGERVVCESDSVLRVSGPLNGLSTFRIDESVGVLEPIGGIPAGAKVRLSPPAPNPFNPWTIIAFDTVDASERVNLAVYDLQGRLVESLVSGHVAPGHHEVRFAGRNSHGEELASGVYLARLEVGEVRLLRRMLLIR